MGGPARNCAGGEFGLAESNGTMELPMDRVGDKLRRGREAAGLSAAELAERTRITARHLEMIEQSNWAGLPGRPYALGFARSYARALGLDGDAIAEEVRQELDAAAATPRAKPSHQMQIDDPTKIPSQRLTWVMALLVVALLAAGLVFWRGFFLPAAPLPPVTAENDLLAETAAAAPSPTAESAVPPPVVEPTGARPGAPPLDATAAPQ